MTKSANGRACTSRGVFGELVFDVGLDWSAVKTEKLISKIFARDAQMSCGRILCIKTMNFGSKGDGLWQVAMARDEARCDGWLADTRTAD